MEQLKEENAFIWTERANNMVSIRICQCPRTALQRGELP